MDIQSVKLRGFKGIKKGMGLDEIDLDFRDMGGMIALSGPTGIGKSSIIENLHPYPQLVSRPNPVLKNHVFLRDSLKELSFLHNGDLFRTVTKIDAQSGRTEGFIYVNGAQGSENDGKITTYKRFCSENFGSTDLFFNSVFAAQNSKKMSAMDPADLKALFVEFLGKRLEILVQQEEVSKQCSNILAGTLGTLQRDFERLNEVIMEHSSAATDLAGAENRKKELVSALIQAERSSKKLEDQHSVAVAKQLQGSGYQERIDALQEDYRDIGLDIDVLNGSDNQSRLGFQKERDAIEAESGKAAGVLLQKDAIEGAAEREKMLSQGLMNHQTILADTNKRLNDSRETTNAKEKEANSAYVVHHEALNAKKEEIRVLESKLTVVNSQGSEAHGNLKHAENDPEIKNLHQRLNLCKEAADAKRGTVTCKPLDDFVFPCNSEDCPQIEKALRAEKEIPVLEGQIKEVQELSTKAIRTLKATVDGLLAEKNLIDKEIKSLKAQEKELVDAYESQRAMGDTGVRMAKDAELLIIAEITSLENNISGIQKEINEAKELAAKLPEIKIAEARLKDLAHARNKLEARMATHSNTHKHLVETKNRKMAMIQADIDKLKEKIDPDINDKIAGLEAKIRNEKFTLGANQDELKRQEANIYGLQANVQTADTAALEMKELQKRRAYIASEQAEWAYLQTKCGAKGIRALEINSVAPSITHDANRLLETAFGAWAMVDFQTLDDEGREVLRPMVIDQDGERVLVANRSGGQQVWAMKALRLAMTMVSKQRSGLDYKTAFADEDDAGLDIETAKSFTRLYRAFLEQGGFNKVFYISHKPACVAMADHIINLGPGGVQ